MKVHDVVVVHGNANKLLPTALKDSVASLVPAMPLPLPSLRWLAVCKDGVGCTLDCGVDRHSSLKASVPDPSHRDGWPHTRMLARSIKCVDFKWCHWNGLSPRFSVTTDWMWQITVLCYFPKVFDVLMGAVSRSIVIVSCHWSLKALSLTTEFLGTIQMLACIRPFRAKGTASTPKSISHSVVILARPTDVGSLMLAPTTVMA